MARKGGIGWILGGAAALLGIAMLAVGKDEDETGESRGEKDEIDPTPKPSKKGQPPVPEFVSGLIWPLPTVDKRKPTSMGTLGASRGTKTGVQKYHTGTDIGAPAGALVIAMEGGTVENTVNGWANDGPIGDTARILIQGDSGNVGNYAAISKKSWEEFGLQEGDRVEAGQPIGRIGTYPGGSTMLHFELYKKGTHDNKKWYKGALPEQLRDSGQWLEWSSESGDTFA